MNRRNANIIWLLTLAILLAVTVLACSEEDNPYWYLDGNRSPGNVIPDTVWVMADRDTTVEIEINTGSSPYLLVGEYGGLEMVAYLKFTSLPDTASAAYAELDLNINGGHGEPFQIQIQLVTSNFDWKESEIRWDSRPEVDPVPLWASAEPISWSEDTTLYAAVLKIPGAIINDWIENSEGNGGIMISKMQADASLGILRILSSEAVLDISGVTIVNPPLTITMADSSKSVHGPARDAYVQTRIEGDPWGSDPTWLGVGGGRPRRTFIGFDLSALHDSLSSGTVFSVAQAALILNPLEGAQDELPTTDSLRVSIIPIGIDPAWSENDSIPDSLQVESGSVLITRGNIELSEERAVFNITTLVSDWINDTPVNGGIAVISDIETRTLDGLRFASRLDAEHGPRLRIIVTYSTTPRPGGK